MEGANLRVLFTYRLLVQAGFLDDDITPGDLSGGPVARSRIVVCEERCIGCYACRVACPASAVRIWDGQAHISDPAACDECVDPPCVAACPTSALEDRRADARS